MIQVKPELEIEKNYIVLRPCVEALLSKVKNFKILGFQLLEYQISNLTELLEGSLNIILR